MGRLTRDYIHGNNCFIMNRFIITLLVCFAFIGVISSEGNVLSNGFGDEIEWKPWNEALDLAKKTEKPIMVLLHKTSCPACKSFKPIFANSKEILELSSKFIMVNAKFGQEPSNEPKLSVDGKYVPRIIFLDSESNVLKEVINHKGNPKYKYFHQTAQTVVQAMESALNIISAKKTSEGTPSTEL